MTHHHASKRSTPRLDPMGLVTAQLSAGTPSIVLKDLSLEGFAIESPCPFRTGSRHDFTFTTHAGTDLAVTAEVVMSRLVAGPRTAYITGFRFVMSAEARRAIDQMIDSVTSPLTFL